MPINDDQEDQQASIEQLIAIWMMTSGLGQFPSLGLEEKRDPLREDQAIFQHF